MIENFTGKIIEPKLRDHLLEIFFWTDIAESKRTSKSFLIPSGANKKVTQTKSGSKKFWYPNTFTTKPKRILTRISTKILKKSWKSLIWSKLDNHHCKGLIMRFHWWQRIWSHFQVDLVSPKWIRFVLVNQKSKFNFELKKDLLKC